jgi:hypothetical protein
MSEGERRSLDAFLKRLHPRAEDFARRGSNSSNSSSSSCMRKFLAAVIFASSSRARVRVGALLEERGGAGEVMAVASSAWRRRGGGEGGEEGAHAQKRTQTQRRKEGRGAAMLFSGGLDRLPRRSLAFEYSIFSRISRCRNFGRARRNPMAAPRATPFIAIDDFQPRCLSQDGCAALLRLHSAAPLPSLLRQPVEVPIGAYAGY